MVGRSGSIASKASESGILECPGDESLLLIEGTSLLLGPAGYWECMKSCCRERHEK